MRCLLGGRFFTLPQQCGGDLVMTTFDSKICFSELDHVAHLHFWSRKYIHHHLLFILRFSSDNDRRIIEFNIICDTE